MNKAKKLTVCRNIASEGAVLLKNENGVLPLKKGSTVAAFGRTFYYCLKGGAGSGDIMGVFPVQPADAIQNSGIVLEPETEKFYRAYNAERFDSELKYWNRHNLKWVNSLPEAPVSLELIKSAAKATDTAIVSFGRNSGEWFDIPLKKGSYFLTDTEEELLKNVTESFKNTVLVLNYCGTLDISFIEKYNVSAILYTSMGGEEAGNATADLLLGNVTPSGKLTDSWCKIDDYITNDNIEELEIPYKEDIFVGYRYFDSFGIKPIYPFGFGLSYTEFDISINSVELSGTTVNIGAEVKNIGNFSGKEVLQVYLSEPKCQLEKAYQQLAAFKKTDLLNVGESQALSLCFDLCDFACYDDATSSFILEAGEYFVRLGNSSRNTKVIAKIVLDKTTATFKTVNRLQPIEDVDVLSNTNATAFSYEGEQKEKETCKTLFLSACDIPCIDALRWQEINELEPKDQSLHTFSEVCEGKITIEQFVAQLTDSELADILNGVTGNTLNVNMNVGTMSKSVEGAAGEIWSSEKYGIRPCINADGPAGIRLGGFIDNEGQIPRDTELSLKMTAFPIGTCLSGTWNPELAEAMGRAIAHDMGTVGIAGWLAPGMNIHRSPLCGRNFEYYSEDPLVTGIIAAATVKGMQTNEDGSPSGYYATIKHFATNNAETHRFESDSIVSERALREIYLKGFKIAVQLSKPLAVMNAYNKINGIYASDNDDLNIGILRLEWGFNGCVMTDWGAKSSSEFMPKAGCDLVMPGCKNKEYLELLENGTIPRAVAQRCAVNVLNLSLKTTHLGDRNDR